MELSWLKRKIHVDRMHFLSDYHDYYYDHELRPIFNWKHACISFFENIFFFWVDRTALTSVWSSKNKFLLVCNYAWFYATQKVHSAIFIMSNFVERRSCIQFSLKMKFRARKHSEYCRKPSVINVCRKEMFTSGASHSKKAENALKMKSAPGDHRHQSMKQTSPKSKILGSKIDG